MVRRRGITARLSVAVYTSTWHQEYLKGEWIHSDMHPPIYREEYISHCALTIFLHSLHQLRNRVPPTLIHLPLPLSKPLLNYPTKTLQAILAFSIFIPTTTGLFKKSITNSISLLSCCPPSLRRTTPPSCS